MANAKKQNVWVIDTTGAITESMVIRSVKLVGTSATLTIKADDTSGAVVYEAASDTVQAFNYDHDLGLELRQGSYVTISGTSARAYLYLE